MRLVSSGDGDGGMWGQSGSACTGRIPTEIRKLHLRYPKNVHQPWPLALKCAHVVGLSGFGGTSCVTEEREPSNLRDGGAAENRMPTVCDALPAACDGSFAGSTLELQHQRRRGRPLRFRLVQVASYSERPFSSRVKECGYRWFIL